MPKARRPETLPSQKQKVSECSNCPVKGSTTQYAQAMAVQDAMNAKIAAAVGEVQQWAKTQPGSTPPTCNWRSPTRAPGSSIRRGATIPGSSERHLDTPEQGRARALANTVTTAMCSAFGQWCGDQPAWDRPHRGRRRRPQKIKGRS